MNVDELSVVNMPDRKDGRAPFTVIGLGPMGQALAGAFLRDGRSTTVWNRTAAKAGRLVAEGAVLAGSVDEAVAASRPTPACESGDLRMVQSGPIVDLGDGGGLR
ncbi:NAD(P)-binding domain-containing protein [Actinomadura sp. 21ATH]|uniref:NAD(P)-binding domain-containing protein n=1 Tax=Actinomadura sp. 21ATH TaxID=1735444 RepID=UPI0035C07AF4